MFPIFLTFALFAAGIFVNKQLLVFLPPTLFVGIRMFFSGIILALYGWHQRKNLKNMRADWPILIVIALFTALIPSLFKAYALTHLPAGQTALLSSIDPFVTALYVYLIWHEKMSSKQLLGIFLGCAGTWISINLACHEMWCLQTILPQIAVIVAVALSRLGWIFVRILLKKDEYSSTQLNSFVMLFCGSCALLVSPLIDTYGSIHIPSGGTFVSLLLFTVLVSNVIGYTLYAYIIRHYNMTLISLAGFSVPLFVSFYERIFMGRVLTAQFVLAFLFLFCGLLIFYWDELGRRKLLITK